MRDTKATGDEASIFNKNRQKKLLDTKNYESVADEETKRSPISEDELLYVENVKENTVEIIRYIGDKQYEELIIPRKINGRLVTKIGKEAFANHQAKKLVIQEGVKYIDWYAFRKCSSLVEIVLPKSLEHIGMRSFEGCCIKKLEIPSGVKRIAEGAFSGCPLTWVAFRCEKAVIGRKSFEGCSLLETIDFIGTVSEIEDYAFRGCGIRCLQLPRGLVKIGKEAFAKCRSLESVFIPKTVMFIKQKAFSRDDRNYRNDNLFSTYCEAKFKPIFWDSFWSCSTVNYWGQKI